MPEDHPPSRIQELRPRPVWQLFLAAGWFALAGAMALWPGAVSFPDASCVTSDDDAGIICFIFESWGTPLGIGISFVLGAITLWGYLNPGASGASAAPGQSSTAAAGSALPGGAAGVQPQRSLGLVGKAIVIVIIAWVIFLVCGTAWLVAWVLLYPYFE